MALVGLVASFLVPGLAVYIRGPRLWGKAALASCGLLLLLFIVWFGHPVGNFAFGLLLSIHISGFVYYCSPLLSKTSFSSRLLFTLLTMMALGLLIYLPIRNVILQHWLVPLRVQRPCVVVQRLVPRRRHQTRRLDRVQIAGGSSETGEPGGRRTSMSGPAWDLAPVLAVAGDRVEFSTNAVQGERRFAHPLLPHMPRIR